MDGEVVVERRRQWSPEHKAALLAEVEAEGGQVSVVANTIAIHPMATYSVLPSSKKPAANGNAEAYT